MGRLKWHGYELLALLCSYNIFHQYSDAIVGIVFSITALIGIMWFLKKSDFIFSDWRNEAWKNFHPKGKCLCENLMHCILILQCHAHSTLYLELYLKFISQTKKSLCLTLWKAFHFKKQKYTSFALSHLQVISGLRLRNGHVTSYYLIEYLWIFYFSQPKMNRLKNSWTSL